MKLKKGDSVIVIAGKDRGKTGTIEAVLPRLGRVVVSGVNAYKKHVKPSAANPKGGVIEAFRSLNASNVMIIDAETKKPSRIGYAIQNSEKVRIAKTSGKALGK